MQRLEVESMTQPTHLDNIVRNARVLRMNGVVMGIVLGLLAGAALFLLTIILVLKGGDVVGPHLALIGQVFPGYRVTFLGSLIGFAYAFVCGYIIGLVGAKLYNAVVDWRQKDQRA